MSRLNLQFTVLSKRRLLKLVNNGYVRGWSDPRMPTISGLRRRGYTKEIINQFCNDVGATRASNVVEMVKLYQTARLQLAATTRRCMAALEPITVQITNYQEQLDQGNSMEFEVQNSPTDESMGVHKVTLTQTIYLDSSDFRLQDSSTYYGLAPNKAVGLKYYGGNLICDEVVKGAGDTIKSLKCHVDKSEGRPKPKTYISWVPSTGITCEVRVYDHLFTVAEPSDLWEEELNSKSEVVYPNARLDPSIMEVVKVADIDPWKSNTALQFERMGYFCVDTDSTPEKLVFNRTVSLKEEVFKKELSADEEAAIEARRAKAKADLVAKESRMLIEPVNFFQEAEEYKGKYSQFHPETGVPTHAADGTELSKSAMKKLEKEKQKHMKQVMKWKKQKGLA